MKIRRLLTVGNRGVSLAIMASSLGLGLLLLRHFSAFLPPFDFWLSVAALAALSIAAGRWSDMGWIWTAALLLSFTAISFYGGDLAEADRVLALKYFLSSPAALVWMAFGFALSFASYLVWVIWPAGKIAVFARSACCLAIVFGFSAMVTRGLEGLLMGPEIGHLPVSSFFEVLVWLAIVCGWLFLFFDRRYDLRGVSLILLTIVVAIVVALFFEGANGGQIRPLMPALQSAWMKIHVPTSFIGYGAFALASACGVGLLGRIWRPDSVILPDRTRLLVVMKQAVKLGFLFFSIGIITGALWAAEAWGAYWQWDPKETWALIVWLNYGAWLHVATAGRRDELLGIWAIFGWLLSLFAFVGVNFWLPGLHSYAS